jgi:hypothetical protein
VHAVRLSSEITHEHHDDEEQQGNKEWREAEDYHPDSFALKPRLTHCHKNLALPSVGSVLILFSPGCLI